MKAEPLQRPLKALMITLLMLLALLLLTAVPQRSTTSLRGAAVQQGDTVPAAMLALGDSVFRGKVAGGTCFSCHRADGKGLPGLAPDLTDGKWLHGDGSLSAIEQVVRSGVPKPKQSAAPMPPMGGAKLNDMQIRAVSAYVLRMSKAEGK